MDQVKKILRIMMAQRFWLLCGAVTLVPVGGWFSVTAHMRKTADARKSAIKQKTDSAKSLLAKQHHPNDESHKSMDVLRDLVTNEVGEAWRIQYERQKTLLVWPDGLLPDFIGVVDPLRPLEQVKPPLTAADEVLRINLRERYRNYIAEELPKLAKKIDAVWHVQDLPEGGNAGAGFMPGSPAGALGTSAPNRTTALMEKVVWSAQDQTALRARYDWSKTQYQVPRTIDVLYAQEDLWIMSALMDIIATTNQGSSARYNAVIKEINYINLGREVGGSTGSVMRISAGGAGDGGMMGGMMGGMGGGMSAMSGMSSSGGMGMSGASAAGAPGAGAAPGGMSSAGSSGMPGMGADGGQSGMGMGTGAMAMMDPAERRYVDLNYQPVSAETLRTAITSETRDPANAFLVVAKRIPIRLGLTVDQRKLNRFISACGNAPLMVEVRQVRFNRQGGSTSGSGGGMGGMGMPGMSGMGGMGMGDVGGSGMGMGGAMGLSGSGGFGGKGMGGGLSSDSGMSSGGFGAGMGMPGGGMGMPGGGMSGLSGGTGPSDVSPHDKPVEIYGVVYLYNPVDVKKLGIENKAADSTTPAVAAPAVAAPAVAAPAVAAPAVAAPAVGGTTPTPPATAAPPAAATGGATK